MLRATLFNLAWPRSRGHAQFSKALDSYRPVPRHSALSTDGFPASALYWRASASAPPTATIGAACLPSTRQVGSRAWILQPSLNPLRFLVKRLASVCLGTPVTVHSHRDKARVLRRVVEAVAVALSTTWPEDAVQDGVGKVWVPLQRQILRFRRAAGARSRTPVWRSDLGFSCGSSTRYYWRLA